MDRFPASSITATPAGIAGTVEYHSQTAQVTLYKGGPDFTAYSDTKRC